MNGLIEQYNVNIRGGSTINLNIRYSNTNYYVAANTYNTAEWGASPVYAQLSTYNITATSFTAGGNNGGTVSWKCIGY